MYTALGLVVNVRFWYLVPRYTTITIGVINKGIQFDHCQHKHITVRNVKYRDYYTGRPMHKTKLSRWAGSAETRSVEFTDVAALQKNFIPLLEL